MTREIALTAGLTVLVWLGYMAWLTGYKAGYGDGEEMAWQRARKAIPALANRTETRTVEADFGHLDRDR